MTIQQIDEAQCQSPLSSVKTPATTKCKSIPQPSVHHPPHGCSRSFQRSLHVEFVTHAIRVLCLNNWIFIIMPTPPLPLPQPLPPPTPPLPLPPRPSPPLTPSAAAAAVAASTAATAATAAAPAAAAAEWRKQQQQQHHLIYHHHLVT